MNGTTDTEGKTIIRKYKKSNFTMVDNDMLRDTTLSWKAKGLLTYLLSLPDDWHIRIAKIADISTDGIASLMSGIRELRKAKYLSYGVVRDPDTKSILYHEYVVYEQPYDSKKVEPQPKKPLIENQLVGNCSTTNTIMTKTDKGLNVTKRNIKPLGRVENTTPVSSFDSYRSDEDKPFEVRYGEHLWSCIKIQSKYRQALSSSYTNQVRDLLNKDKISKQRLKDVFRWYIEHLHDDYVPKLYHVQEIRSKFLRIEQAMIKFLKRSKDAQYDPASDAVAYEESFLIRTGRFTEKGKELFRTVTCEDPDYHRLLHSSKFAGYCH